LAGLLGNVGLRGEERDYAGSHGKKFHIFPGSGLAKKGPKWIMAAELVETARVFARTVAEIQPAWVEQAAAHLVKRHHSDPHWERRAARVAAFESVTLYGLTLVQRRKVNYGPIAPAESRELFIRRALVEGDYDTRAEFFQHNRGLLQEVQDMEDKVRRRDLLVDEETLFAFYDGLVPEGVYDGPRFERWRRDAEADQPRLLYLTRDKLLREGADTGGLEQFPDHLRLDGMVLPLEYRFEPGHSADGVTAVVPLAALNQLAPEPLEWLVPGLLRDKLVALIKGLPKALRRNFVPAPDFADACLPVLEVGRGGLPQALAAQLKRMTGVTVPDAAWQPEQLPAHLRLNLRVTDERGRVMAEGRELSDLQAQLGGRARRSFAAQPEGEWGRAQVETWDFGDLPESVEMRRGGATLQGFPALAAHGEQVALRLFDTRDKAAAAHRDGLCRLFMFQHRKDVQYLRRNLPGIQQMCLYYAPMGACEALKDDLVMAAVNQALDLERDIRGADEFERRSEDAQARLVSVGNELCRRTGSLLAEYHQVAKQLRASVPPAWLEAVADVRDQLQWLVYPGFLRLVPAEVLAQYPRYLKAVQRRLERLAQQPGRDRQTRLEIEPLWRAWRERAGDPPGPLPDALAEFHWLLEELRVSLFAQDLGTAAKVSVKRLGAQWKALATG
jgi:ATP-dependent helicase HrpA